MSPADAAQRQLDAYNARDLEAFLAVYAPQCRVRAFPSGRVLMANRAEMAQRYGRLFAERPDLCCTLLSRTCHEAFAIDEERVEGLVEGEVVHAVAIYEVRDALIRNVWFLRHEPESAAGDA